MSQTSERLSFRIPDREEICHSLAQPFNQSSFEKRNSPILWCQIQGDDDLSSSDFLYFLNFWAPSKVAWNLNKSLRSEFYNCCILDNTALNCYEPSFSAWPFHDRLSVSQLLLDAKTHYLDGCARWDNDSLSQSAWWRRVVISCMFFYEFFTEIHVGDCSLDHSIESLLWILDHNSRSMMRLVCL